MIEFTESSDGAVTRLPNEAEFRKLTLQPRWRVANGDGGLRLVLEWEAGCEALLALSETPALQPGAIALPAGCGVRNPTEKIILDEVEIDGEEGDAATLRAVYRRRNARETDGDVADGLHRRNVSARWVERQEVIEHWAARRATAENPFNGTLFALWLQEADPAAKVALQVTRGEGDLVSLDNTDEADDWKGSDLTKAVAERYALGVQYAAQAMLQVEVAERWRKPPKLDGRCNVRLPSGIPSHHRPLFGMNKVDGRFEWIRHIDSVSQVGESSFDRQVVYLGIPNSMRPSPAPTGWGDGPIDELLYPAIGDDAPESGGPQ